MPHPAASYCGKLWAKGRGFRCATSRFEVESAKGQCQKPASRAPETACKPVAFQDPHHMADSQVGECDSCRSSAEFRETKTSDVTRSHEYRRITRRGQADLTSRLQVRSPRPTEPATLPADGAPSDFPAFGGGDCRRRAGGGARRASPED